MVHESPKKQRSEFLQNVSIKYKREKDVIYIFITVIFLPRLSNIE